MYVSLTALGAYERSTSVNLMFSGGFILLWSESSDWAQALTRRFW